MNLRIKTVKLNLQKTGANFCEPGFGNGFLARTATYRQSKIKRDKLDFLKIKVSCFKRHYQESKKGTLFDNSIASGIYKELLQLQNKSTT